ncbi:hypothetical protein BU17DRAFT_69777 [Hysterangium stoloniferum]|nr:hypothetical protein BU17DRAFT_69777 [Hysterangium stoloniferum]
MHTPSGYAPGPHHSESDSDSSSSSSSEDEQKKVQVKGQPVPSLLPPSTANVPSENEKALKEKFRTFWMSSVADAFKDDLEEIRKESNMTTSRLSLLIDSLASGADVFSSTMPSGETAVNEMEVVLGST